MKTKAFIYIILAGLAWGTTGIFVNFLAPYGFDSLQITGVRGLVAFLFMLLYVLIRDKSLLRVKMSDFLFIALNGVTIFATSSLYFLSLQMTSNATGVVLMYTAPVYVMLFSVLVWKEKFSCMKLVAVVAMLIGCCLVAGVIGGIKFNALGILFGVLSGISYAIYNIITKYIMKRGAHPTTTTMYSFLFMAISAACVCRVWEIPTYIANGPTVSILCLVGIGIVGCTLPYLFYTMAMKDLPAGTASALGIIEPMAATVFAAIIFHQIPDVFQIIGIILILLSVFLLGMAENGKMIKTKGKD